jgi:hypothetical protein
VKAEDKLPLNVRNDVIGSTSLRGVFDVAIHAFLNNSQHFELKMDCRAALAMTVLAVRHHAEPGFSVRNLHA